MAHQWIKDRLNDLGRTQVQLAERLGVDNAAISNVLKGTRQVKTAELQPLAEFLDMPISEVLTGLGAADSSARFIDLGAFASADVVGFVQAGLFRESVELPLEERYRVHFPVIPGGARVFGLEVRGDSMNEVFRHGDVLICQTLFEFGGPPEDGMYVVVERRWHDEIEATVKLLRIYNGEYWLEPRSTNPEFKEAWKLPPPAEWNGDENTEIRVTAIVVRSIQNRLPTA